MAFPPLHLSILRLSPATLLDAPLPIPLPASSPNLGLTPQHDPVPRIAAPRPSVPANFSFSPTHNYPAPFPSMALGCRLGAHVQLAAAPGAGAGEGVRGVKMMLEVQGQAGRWRLGEVIHGAAPVTGEEGGSEVVDQSGSDQSKVRLKGKGKEKEKDTGVEKAKGSSEEEEQGDTELEDGTEEAQAEEGDGTLPFPLLPPGEFVELDVGAEMKELGLQVLICSVAWETDEGRRTFQRFFKFNVIAPLAIKTRIHASLTPATQLDPARRSDVFLEVLMQNTSGEATVFERVTLEPVYGMTAMPVTSFPSLESHAALPASGLHRGLATPPATPPALSQKKDDDVDGGNAEGDQSLLPGDTRQYLFLLRPAPPAPSHGTAQSVFPPDFPPGTVLPLGRLDVNWVSGPYREKGRLQTSTLNRRVPTPAIPPVPKIQLPDKLEPTKTTSAAAPVLGQSVVMPELSSPGVARNTDEADRREAEPVAEKEWEWEYDLAILDLRREGVEQDDEFVARIRVAVRSLETVTADVTPDGVQEGEKRDIRRIALLPPPRPIFLGVQHLIHPVSSGPYGSGPSQSNTPYPRSPTPGRAGSARPFSPASPAGPDGLAPTSATTGPSRARTPISAQLRQAAQSHLSTPSGSQAHLTRHTPSPSTIGPPIPALLGQSASSVLFPPPPTLSRPAVPPKSASSGLTGRVHPLGSSLLVSPPLEFDLAQEQYSTTYADSAEPPLHWEASTEVSFRFVALQEGLAALGGMRVLLLKDERGLDGTIGREWDSLGEVWVTA